MTPLTRAAALAAGSALLTLCCSPLAFALTAPPPSTSVSPAPVALTPDSVVFDGLGFGHGVGLQQDGALTMGQQGKTVDDILGAFYPGTSYGSAGGPIRVAVDSQASTATEVLTAPAGATLHGDSDTVVPAGTVLTVRRTATGWSAVLHDPSSDAKPSSGAPSKAVHGRVVTDDLLDPTATATDTATDSPTDAPSPSGSGLGDVLPSTSDSAAPSGSASAPASASAIPSGASSSPSVSATPSPSSSASAAPTALPDRTVTSVGGFVLDPGASLAGVRGRTYDGMLSVVLDGTSLHVVDTLDVETYLLGLGEVLNPTWPQASLRAQAVAARTYALHNRNGAAPFDVWDDDRSQVYLGTQSEYAALTQAVQKTRGVVLTFGGDLADTVFSASAGGVTATPEEGFGSVSGPAYLRAATYPTSDPHPWNLTTTLASVGGALSYPGTLTDIAVSQRGPSGRATTVHLDGSSGGVDMTGIAVLQALDLHSTLFQLTVGTAPAPAAADIPSPANLPSVLDSSGLTGPSLAQVQQTAPVALVRRGHGELSGGLVALATLLVIGTSAGLVFRVKLHASGRHRALVTPTVVPDAA